MSFCPYCGNALPDDPAPKFCPHCGKPLGQNAVPVSGSTGVPVPKAAITLTEQQKKILAGAVVVVLCALLGTGIRLFRNRPAPEPAKTETDTHNEGSDISEDTPSIDDGGGVQDIIISPEQDTTDDQAAAVPDQTSSDQSVIKTGVVPVPSWTDTAVSNAQQIVIHQVLPNATITVDGQPIAATLQGTDAIISRADLQPICVVRAIAPVEGGFATAAVWYNSDYDKYGDRRFGDLIDTKLSAYGLYEYCRQDGMSKPSDKVLDILNWAHFYSFIESVNTRDIGHLRYTTDDYRAVRQYDLQANGNITFDLHNFSAYTDPSSLRYDADSATAYYNAQFTAPVTDNNTGEEITFFESRTFKIQWQNGMWIVCGSAVISAEDYSNHVLSGSL